MCPPLSRGAIEAPRITHGHFSSVDKKRGKPMSSKDTKQTSGNREGRKPSAASTRADGVKQHDKASSSSAWVHGQGAPGGTSDDDGDSENRQEDNGRGQAKPHR